MGIKKEEDQHVYIPDDIWESIGLYVKAEHKRMNNPLIRELITKKSLVLHILRNEVQKQGHYVGKVKAK
jgi:hypothetical protein